MFEFAENVVDSGGGGGRWRLGNLQSNGSARGARSHNSDNGEFVILEKINHKRKVGMWQ